MILAMNPQSLLTLLGAVVGIVGTLGAVYLGQRMSRTWQREQWIRDNRIMEFRKLLNALADSLRVEMTLYAGAVLEPDQQKAIVESHASTMRTIRTRIFTIDFVQRTQIEVTWSEALQQHQKMFDVPALAAVFSEIRNQILIDATSRNSKKSSKH